MWVAWRYVWLAGLGSMVACGSTAGSAPTPSKDTASGKADVYGDDDRVERYEIEEGDVREFFAQASAASVVTRRLERTEEGWTHDARSLGERQGLCEGERFIEQPTLARCSATLVADDLVLTSGHCLGKNGDTEQSARVIEACEDRSYVFDYAYRSPDDDVRIPTLPADNVYACAEVLALAWDDSTEFDYALVRLDRPVTGRTPVPVRAGGPMRPGARVVQIGHPARLPQKLAEGVVIERECSLGHGFNYEADIFGGNSGGGVFDLETGALVGIPSAYSGKNFVADADRSCSVVGVCGENVVCRYAPGAFDTSTMLEHLDPALAERLRIIDAGPNDVPVEPPSCDGDTDGWDTDGWGTTSDSGFGSAGFMGGSTTSSG